MSEFRTESASFVNAEKPVQSAISAEAYDPKSWMSFEKLKANSSHEISSDFLDMSASDPYANTHGAADAPEIGDPNRIEFRQKRQEAAVYKGILSGQIDDKEFDKLKKEQNLISQIDEYFGANGYSGPELQMIDDLQNNARKHILKAGGENEVFDPGCENGDKETPEGHECGKDKDETPKEEHGGEKEDHGGEEDHDGEKEHNGGEEETPEHETDEQTDRLTNYLDQNGDGKITLAELLQAFKAIDANGDGVVTPEEFQQFMDKLNQAAGPTEEPGHEKPPKPISDGGAEEDLGEEETPEKEPLDDSGEDGDEENGEDGDGNDHGEEPDKPDSNEDTAKLIYIFPESNEDWQKINRDSPEGSLIVTLPPGTSWDSDKPFDSVDPQLQRNISDATDSGLNPLGYVGTRGGTRPIEEVKEQIDSWFEHSEVQGIYLGDSGNHNGGGYATDSASEAYFKEIGQYIKSKGGFAAINGSGSPNPDYMDTFDLQGTFEGYASNYDKNNGPAAWQQNYSPDRFAAMLVGVGSNDIARREAEARANHNGYIFIAPDYGVSPTSSNSYWNKVVDNLDGIEGNR